MLGACLEPSSGCEHQKQRVRLIAVQAYRPIAPMDLCLVDQRVTYLVIGCCHVEEASMIRFRTLLAGLLAAGVAAGMATGAVAAPSGRLMIYTSQPSDQMAKVV